MDAQHQHHAGHPVLDQQHRHLRALLEIVRHAAAPECSQTVDLVLEYLLRFLEIHFENEEEFLRTYAAPGLPQHAAEHAVLLQQLREHADRFRVSGSTDYDKLRALALSIHRHSLGTDGVVGQGQAAAE